VLEVNQEKQRISLGMKQMTEDPWIHAIPEKYIPGQIIKGKIAKLTNFGAFVELEPELEGLLHISELADHKIDKPQDVVKPGDDVEVKILKVDPEARKIGLSLRRVQWAAAPAEEHPTSAPKKPSKHQVSAPAVDAGGDTLRVKEALQRRAQARAVAGPEPSSQEPAGEPKPEEEQAGG
jgi:small subunit ribosomal protein S1